MLLEEMHLHILVCMVPVSSDSAKGFEAFTDFDVRYWSETIADLVNEKFLDLVEKSDDIQRLL
jgi:hypothetical protein